MIMVLELLPPTLTTRQCKRRLSSSSQDNLDGQVLAHLLGQARELSNTLNRRSNDTTYEVHTLPRSQSSR